MICKLFFVVISRDSDTLLLRSEARNDGFANYVRSFEGGVGGPCKAAFALREPHDRLFVDLPPHYRTMGIS